ncbi:MAG: hypothetical protein JSS21_00955, partial [Proteobacteria bacterium]|nr:hypothetical protein [Pseudomonadota bacterium]
TAATHALRDGRAPVESFRLRDEQRVLAAALRAAPDDLPAVLAAALLDASDRIVDSIDSLLHTLQADAAAAPPH